MKYVTDLNFTGHDWSLVWDLIPVEAQPNSMTVKDLMGVLEDALIKFKTKAKIADNEAKRIENLKRQIKEQLKK